jgi:hypothetical protein
MIQFRPIQDTMSLPFLILKVALVAIFLVMFLRTNKATWGIGLLTVTTAILLDTLLSTFSREEILTELGFFFYIIAGALFAGAAFWFWGLLRDLSLISSRETSSPKSDPIELTHQSPISSEVNDDASTAFDRQELYNQVKYRFGPEDLRDLIFDLNLSEGDVLIFSASANQTINRIIDLAVESGQSSQLALAVERILTPFPAENLPRIEKIGPGSPPTILRHFFLANYSLDQLQQLCLELDIDWQIIAGDNKDSKVRNLLLYLQRRNRTAELISLIREQDAA